MAAYRRVYDSRYLQADCQEPGSAPEPYARQSSMGSLYHFTPRVWVYRWHRWFAQVACWQRVDATPTGDCASAEQFMLPKSARIMKTIKRRYIAAMTSSSGSAAAMQVCTQVATVMAATGSIDAAFLYILLCC